MFYAPKNKKSSRKETKWVKLPVSCNTWLKSSFLCTLSDIVLIVWLKVTIFIISREFLSKRITILVDITSCVS